MYPRVSLDANGNERRKGVKKTSLTGNTSGQLSLGVFARSLYEKANDDSGGKDANEDDLSPNSIRQVMFFPRSNPKPIKDTVLKPPCLNDSWSTGNINGYDDSVTKQEDNGLSPDPVRKLVYFNSRVNSKQPLREPNSMPPIREPISISKPSLWEPNAKSPTREPISKPPSWEPNSKPPLREPISISKPSLWEPNSKTPLCESNPKPPLCQPNSQPPLWEPNSKPPLCESNSKPPLCQPNSKPPSWEPKSKPPIPEKIIKSPLGIDSWKIGTESVQGKEFLIIKTLGQGGSGEVFLVVEKEHKNLYAMKKVHLAGVNETVIRECVNEITMLQELRGTELVIRIDSWEINKVDKTMKIIMEYGHSDLGASLKVSKFSLQEVRSTWESILKIVSIIHSRGIVHADLKPANFVWVGHRLKIIDFGIASRLQNDNTSILMLNPKGTVNYISPETISPDEVTGKLKIGPKSDIWSIGCILYLLVYGQTPFHAYTNFASKIGAIVKGIIHYPPLPPEFEGTGVDSILKLCFLMDHRQRPSADELLRHRFLSNPSSSANRQKFN